MPTRTYVCLLETFLKRLLGKLSIPTVTSPHTGTFVDADHKIASIGIHLQKRITSHGFALNVDNQPLPWFRNIVACGLDDVRLTSIQEQHARLGIQWKPEAASASVVDGLQLPMTVQDLLPMAVATFEETFDRPLLGQAALDDEQPDEFEPQPTRVEQV